MNTNGGAVQAQDEAKPTDVIASIQINLTREGNVLLTGPLHDKIFCFGLLEGAKMIVASGGDQPAKSSLVSPHDGRKLPLAS
jgi:hypothetical protein